MSHRQKKDHLDPKLQEQIEKVEKHDHWVDHIFRRILHVLERIIAMITLLALLTALGVVIDPTTDGAADSDRAMTY